METTPDTTKISGTFVQQTPAPGRTWHIYEDHFAAKCGMSVRHGFEWWTTDQMQSFKVCANCLKGN